MLFVCMIVLIRFLLHVVHDSMDTSIVTLAHDLLFTFAGTLIGGLKGNSSRQQMTDRVETLTPGPKTDVTVSKVDTVNLAQPVATQVEGVKP